MLQLISEDSWLCMENVCEPGFVAILLILATIGIVLFTFILKDLKMSSGSQRPPV